MYKNNFDCSSTGINIEVEAYYSTTASQIIFNDAYDVVRYRGREVALLIRRYDFDRQIDKITDVGKFKSGKRGRLSKETICEILNELSSYSYDTQSFTYEELNEELDNLDIQNLPDALKEFSQFFKLNDDVDLYTSRGYCQGDVSYVLYKAETSKNYHNLIDRELWDCPIESCVVIGNVRYDYNELMDNPYVWKKEGFMKKVVDSYTVDNEVKEFVSRQLNNMLPEELDYV